MNECCCATFLSGHIFKLVSEFQCYAKLVARTYSGILCALYAYHLTVCAKTDECVLECKVFFGTLGFTAFVAEIIKEVSPN
jgi:hypothetical protein